MVSVESNPSTGPAGRFSVLLAVVKHTDVRDSVQLISPQRLSFHLIQHLYTWTRFCCCKTSLLIINSMQLVEMAINAQYQHERIH